VHAPYWIQRRSIHALWPPQRHSYGPFDLIMVPTSSQPAVTDSPMTVSEDPATSMNDG
jgi:hypothetical protein